MSKNENNSFFLYIIENWEFSENVWWRKWLKIEEIWLCNGNANFLAAGYYETVDYFQNVVSVHLDFLQIKDL